MLHYKRKLYFYLNNALFDVIFGLNKPFKKFYNYIKQSK